jgi:hypothetical protein
MILNNFPAKIRPSVVAGMFYPGHEKELRNTVQNYLKSAGEAKSELKIDLCEITTNSDANCTSCRLHLFWKNSCLCISIFKIN